MINLSHVSVNFDTQRVLNDISVTINPGDSIAVMGRNGAGKSTLLSVIAGMIKPTCGSIWIDDDDITNWTERQRAYVIARLFQDPMINTVGSMSVLDNLILAQLKRRRVRIKKPRLILPQHVIDFLHVMHNDVDEFLQKKMYSLSGGQRQIIAFIMATMNPSKILLLDEPTAALDVYSAQKMLELVNQMIKVHAITTLFITHDHNVAQQLGNRFWIMENGIIVQDSMKNSIKS